MKIKVIILSAFLIMSFLVSGCAGYSIREGGEGEGYDVYRPEPYLLVVPATKNKGMSAEIIWLPNYSERYRIDTWNFLGKADFQFAIEDGWRLTEISDQSDNSEVASELLGVLEKATKPETLALTGDVQLFRLVYNNQGEFVGMKFVPAE